MLGGGINFKNLGLFFGYVAKHFIAKYNNNKKKSRGCFNYFSKFYGKVGVISWLLSHLI